MTAATTILEAFLYFTLLAVLPWQAVATTNPTTPAMSPPTHDELTSSLYVNQLAILHLMNDSSNTSCAAAEIQRESDVDRKNSKRLEQAHWERMDRLLAALEVQQKTPGKRMDRLLAALEVQQKAPGERMDRLLATLEVQQKAHGERMDRLLATLEVQQKAHGKRMDRLLAALEVQQRHTQQVLDTKNSSALDALLREVVNSESSLTSFCSGNTTLTGTFGALEVTSSGNYDSNTTCSWNLKFPKRMIVSITWDYIEMEHCGACHCDWLEVLDVTRNIHIYGKKLCGQRSSSFIKLLNLRYAWTNNVMVNFRSDRGTQFRGFKMLYRAH